MLPTKSKFEFTQLWPIILINFFLWTIIPSLVFGNLHTDTLEAAYWSRDIAFGYEKHPPLLSWLIKIFEFPGPYGIFPLLSLGQIFSLIATLCIYKSINLLFDKQAAFVGAILSQLSSSATFYALQINHNTALIPIFAAALYFGLKYIKEQDWINSIAFGIAFGLGALTKYQIIFVIPILLTIIVIEKKILLIFRLLKTYLSFVISVIIVIPHLLWLKKNDWSSVERAVGPVIFENYWFIIENIHGLSFGILATIGFPVVYFFVTFRKKKCYHFASSKYRNLKLIGYVIFWAPIFSMAVSTLSTGQYIKALWILPIMPALVIGFIFIYSDRIYTKNISKSDLMKSSGLTTIGIFLLYSIYLASGLYIGYPNESYLAATKSVSEKAEGLWKSYSESPLKCVITDELKLGPSPVLWINSFPMILPLAASKWSTEKRINDCILSGGVAIKFVHDGRFPIEEVLPNSCKKNSILMNVGTIFDKDAPIWEAEIFIIPSSINPICP